MGITTGLNWLGPDIRIFNKSVIHLRNYKANDSQEINDTDKKYQGKNERKKYLHANSRKSQHFKIIGAFLVIGLILITILTAALSIQNSIKYTTAPDRLINQNWVRPWSGYQIIPLIRVWSILVNMKKIISLSTTIIRYSSLVGLWALHYFYFKTYP